MKSLYDNIVLLGNKVHVGSTATSGSGPGGEEHVLHAKWDASKPSNVLAASDPGIDVSGRVSGFLFSQLAKSMESAV